MDYLDQVRTQPGHRQGAPPPSDYTSQSTSEREPSYSELQQMAAQAAVREGIKPYSQGKRIGYSLIWAFWTFAFALGCISLMGNGSVLVGLLSGVLAFFAGRYTYRIWTYQAKRLWFFIVF